MSPLERRCRLLMRAYPAGYRRERGDEIIATCWRQPRSAGGGRWLATRGR